MKTFVFQSKDIHFIIRNKNPFNHRCNHISFLHAMFKDKYKFMCQCINKKKNYFYYRSIRDIYLFLLFIINNLNFLNKLVVHSLQKTEYFQEYLKYFKVLHVKIR